MLRVEQRRPAPVLLVVVRPLSYRMQLAGEDDQQVTEAVYLHNKRR